jgi:hypothetical protein
VGTRDSTIVLIKLGGDVVYNAGIAKVVIAGFYPENFGFCGPLHADFAKDLGTGHLGALARLRFGIGTFCWLLPFPVSGIMF